MDQPALTQRSWGSGQLTVELEARFDLKAWYQGARRLLNFQPIPQGGFTLMPASRYLGRGRRVPASLALTEVASDNGPHVPPWTVREWNFGGGGTTVVPLSFVTLPFQATVAGAGDPNIDVLVQYLDTGGVWRDLAPAFHVEDEEARDRVAARPPGGAVQAKGLRIRALNSAVSTTVAPLGVAAYGETAGVSGFQKSVLRGFKFGSSEGYIFAYTVGPPAMIDVWRDGLHVGATTHALNTTNRLRQARIAQQFDTLLHFHQFVESERIMRRGGDHEWERDVIPWDAIAKIDLGGTYPKTNDEWELWQRWVDDSPTILALNVIVNGEETGGIEWNRSTGTAASWAADVQAAILALPSIKPGVTVSGVDMGGKQNKLIVIFGGDNAGVRFNVVAQIMNTGDSASFAVHSEIGKTDYEPVMSAARGWPGAAAFFQDRLLPGGFRSKPAGIAASRTGEYFDLNTEAIGPETAAFFNIGNTGAETIKNIYSGRHLLVFTDANIYFISDRVIDKTQPVNFTFTGKLIAHPNADVAEIDDQVFFLSEDGALLYASEYDEMRTRYVSEPASLLTDLVLNARETTLQRASSKTDASVFYLGRNDGRLIAAYIIRGEELLGFGEWGTSGFIDSIAVEEVSNTLHLAVTRQVAGQDEVFIERFEEGNQVDAAITRIYGTPQTLVDGLGSHEGATVWAIADGFWHGPFIVAGGQITLPIGARNITVGRWTPPIMETLPLINIRSDNVVQIRPGRIHTVHAFVIDTTSIAVGANRRRPRDVAAGLNQALYRYGMQTDVPPAPVTRQLRVTGIRGFTNEPTAIITQVRPGKITVRDIALGARL